MPEIIDLGQAPRPLFPDWKVKQHNGRGKLVWNPNNIDLYRPQANTIEDLLSETSKLDCLNDNVLVYLYRRPESISPTWKVDGATPINCLRIFFLGTVWGYIGGQPDSQFVRRLEFWGGQWRIGNQRMKDTVDINSVVATLKK